jgi:hypothetical protein
MEDVGQKVGKMLDEEAGWDSMKEAMEEPTLDRLKKKYLWWLSTHQEEGPKPCQRRLAWMTLSHCSRAETPGCRKSRH